MLSMDQDFHENKETLITDEYSNSPPNSTSSSNHNTTNNNGVSTTALLTPSSLSTPPQTPKSTPRSIDANPYPTTFVQADALSFKQVVQLLTGSTETAAKQTAAATTTSFQTPSKNLHHQQQQQQLPPTSKSIGPKKQAFKALYERRSSSKILSPLLPAQLNSSINRKHQEIISSPSLLDFPSLSLSPVTPLIPDPFNRSPNHPNSEAAVAAEDRAIAKKGFYLHPSPRGTEKPRLLPLFPVTSPRAAADSSI